MKTKTQIDYSESSCRAEWQAEARHMTLEKLPAFLEKLSKFDHDYGTICVGIGAAAVAAAWALEHSPAGGITGFQAGAVMWEMVKGWMTEYRDKPIRLTDYSNMLYPQYSGAFQTISKKTWEYLQKTATKFINETPKSGCAEVRAHWQSIVDGKVPFGYRVNEEE